MHDYPFQNIFYLTLISPYLFRLSEVVGFLREQKEGKTDKLGRKEKDRSWCFITPIVTTLTKDYLFIYIISFFTGCEVLRK